MRGKRHAPLRFGSAAFGLLAFIAIIFVFGQAAIADTYVSGNITTDTIWGLSGSPSDTVYIVTGTVRVYSGATLTIEPGVQVRFDLNTHLLIGFGGDTGTLIADGQPGNEIVFTAENTSSPWGSIYFTQYTGAGSSLSHAIVEYGGYNQTRLIRVYGTSDPSIENCTIRNSDGDGLLLENNAQPTLVKNAYNDNARYPIVVNHPWSVSAVDGTSSFSGNGDERVEYTGGNVTSDTLIRDPGIPYLITYRILVNNSATLTIEPGAELQFDTGTYLLIGYGGYEGTLIAQGTDDKNVVFTSSQASPAPGDWYGIRFSSDNGNGSVLRKAVVEYGGGSSSNYRNIRIQDSDVTIDSCIIRHAVNYGICIDVAGITPQIQCNTITANDIGIYLRFDSVPVIHDNNIMGNTTYGIQNVDATQDIDATDNYWGAADGPSGEGAGSGDAVSTYVNFNPFRVASAPCTIPLNASFNANPVNGCEDLTVQFTDGSAGNVDTWEWDFDGDSVTDSTDQNPTWTYTDPDTYTATLTVYEGTDSDTATMNIDVTESLPTADFSGGPLLSGTPPLTVDFTDNSTVCGTEPITDWEWDFDDDGVVDDYSQDPSYTFYSAGQYTVSLVVTDSDSDSDTMIKQNYVYVSDVAPVSDPNGPYTGTEGQAIQFDGSGSYDPNGGNLTYEWDFNDDGIVDSTAENPWYIYTQDSEAQSGGVYNVTLTVYDQAGQPGTNTTSAQMADTEPVAEFTADQTSGTVALTVNFTDLTSSHDGIVSWTWDFGDGSGPDIQQNPSHTYTVAGTYSVTLSVAENDGDTDVMSKTDYITVGQCFTFYRDDDQDTYGTSDSQCLAQPAYPYTASLSGDCDDGDPLINPGAQEVCDGVDNNCDGQVDEGCGGCAVNETLGDLDADCDVDFDDRNILWQSLRKCQGNSGYNADADYDGDGCITFGDYRIWYGYYLAAQ